VLNHHHGIRTLRHAGAGHDLDALPSQNRRFEASARAKFSDAFESRAGSLRIGGTHRETITRGTVKWRIVTIGEDRFGQNAAKSLLDFDLNAEQRPLDASSDVDYFLPRVSVGQHEIP
jgi:hypothetical protein